MGSLVFSILCVLVSFWLFNRGNHLAEKRMTKLYDRLRKLAEAEDESGEKTPEQEKAFKEFWIDVSDILIARIKEKDAKIAGAIIGGQTQEVRGIFDIIKKAKESKKPEDFLENLTQWTK